MKKVLVLSITALIISTSVLTSCKYGFHELIRREDDVNQRSPVVKKFDNTEFAPTEFLPAKTKIETGKYSVLFISDVHFGRGNRKEDKFFEKLSAVKTEIEAEYPLAFATCGGDVVEAGLGNYYNQYTKFCQKLEDDFEIKTYTVTGNHDLFNSGYANWEKYVYPYSSSYSFTTTASGKKTVSWYFLDSGSGTLGKNQLENFRLVALADPNPKIIVTHYPIYTGGVMYFTMQNKTERDELISILAQSNTLTVLEGHSHVTKDYKMGKYFTEHLTGSFLDNRTFAIVCVDLGEGTCKYKRYTY